MPCGFGAVAVLFFSNVVNRGLHKMTPRMALVSRLLAYHNVKGNENI